jgi:hypothetical protein
MSWWNKVRQTNSQGHNISALGDVTVNELHEPPSPPPVDPLKVKRASISDVADRFLQVFEWHGVAEGQIPKFLLECEGPSMTLHDLSSKGRLLRRLDDELLDFTQETFALHRDWLRVGSPTSDVLSSRDFYKGVEGLASFLLITSGRKSGTTFWPGVTSSAETRGTLYMVANRRPRILDDDDDDDYADYPTTVSADEIHVGAIFQSEICTFEGKTIYRYFPFKALRWDYWRSCYQTVAIMSVADYCGAIVLGVLSGPGQDIYNLCGGRRFPTEIARNDYSLTSWHPRYPYFGGHAWANDPSYKKRWEWYLERFELHDYPGTNAA